MRRSSIAARVAERRGDAGDRAEERPAYALAARRRVAVAVAAEQLDLDRVHRVDVRVAEADRALERPGAGRAARGVLDDPRAPPRPSARARRRSCSQRRSRSGPPGRARGSRGRCRGSTSRASSRGSRRACGRTASRGRGGGARRATVGAPRRAPSPQPYQAGSRQRFCVQAKTHGMARSAASSPRPSRPARRRPRADLEQRELVDRREGAEERGQNVVLVDERAVGARARAPRAADMSSRAAVVGTAGPGRLREGGEQRRGDGRFEVPLGKAGQPVLEGDRLALLGQPEPARRLRRRLRQDRRRASGRRRARCCRRGRGRSSARRRASLASATSARCAAWISHWAAR